MAKPKKTEPVKRKTPNKKAHKDRAVYSLARNKKGKPDLQYAGGEHLNGTNGSLHEDAIPYRTEFSAVLDVAPPSALKVESKKKNEKVRLRLCEDYEQAVLDIFD